jgi:hypothetical protein
MAAPYENEDWRPNAGAVVSQPENFWNRACSSCKKHLSTTSTPNSGIVRARKTVRRCNKFARRSQYEQAWQRALRRANELKQRLGIDVGIGEPFPEKPKGMWARTFDYLLAEMLEAEILAYEAQANMVKPIFNSANY